MVFAPNISLSVEENKNMACLSRVEPPKYFTSETRGDEARTFDVKSCNNFIR